MNLKTQDRLMQGHYTSPLCPEDAKRNPEKLRQAMEDTTKELPGLVVGVAARATGLEVGGELVGIVLSHLEES